MPSARPSPRALSTRPPTRRLTLLESGRTIAVWHAIYTALGMTLHLATVSALVVVSSMQYVKSLERADTTTSARYLAPVPEPVQRTSEERLTYMGLTSGEVGVPEPDVSGDGPPQPLQTVGVGFGGDSVPVDDVPLTESSLEAFALSEIEVDSVVELDPTSAGPPYPPDMLEAGKEGEVYARYIVDTLGRADITSFLVLATNDPAFTRAVIETLPLMKFRPALSQGIRVPQVVQQRFQFRIQPPPVVDTLP
jgi:protein TonB